MPSPTGLPPRASVKILKKASRSSAGRKLATILEAIVSKNDHASWDRLFRFSSRCLRAPKRGGRRCSLATVVNRQLEEETDSPESMVRPCTRQRQASSRDPIESLAARISVKLEEGDFGGAVRLASSDDTLAAMNDSTFTALQDKHPSPHPDSHIPPLQLDLQSQSISISVMEEDIIKAVRSFPNGSAGGPDGLKPQHLKDMIGPSAVDGFQALLPALTSFVKLVLEGRAPSSITPYFFGANLTALQKKDGGVRPIAVGCTLRRLAAKVAGSKMMEEMGELLAPRQLGYGVRGGAEAAVHAARLYLLDLDPTKAVLKLDFKNAFNSIRRDKLLEAVRELAPGLLEFVHSAYSSPSVLYWADRTLQSAEGVQQGDPLGPLLFCLTIHELCSHLQSELCLFYLDDGTLGGSVRDLEHDLEVVERLGTEIGLQLNRQKTEIVCPNTTMASLLFSLPGARVVDPLKATLLGSPIGDVSCISDTLSAKTNLLRKMGDRLQLLSAHDAILLLRHSFALPKLLYCLRTSPCFLSPGIQEYDVLLKDIVSGITNVRFGEGSSAWAQATLPVKLGGFGIRCAAQIAPCAYLASTAASTDLVQHIVPPHLRDIPVPYRDEAETLWSKGHDHPPPVGTTQRHQKTWDNIKATSIADSLLETAPDARARARLLASSARESGVWLNVLPISSLGLRMDDDTIRVAVGLRLGAPLCRPHTCCRCGSEVDALATHGLSCRQSQGRHFRHAALNGVIHRSLTSARIPSRLEPSGLQRSDGKRPDGVTMVPWRCGKLLVWDATSPDTFAPSYSLSATSEAGAVAAGAEARKRMKYICLEPVYSFVPIAVESSGVFGPQTLEFLKELGHRLSRVTGEEKSYIYLLQRLSVAVQRGNAASVLGTLGLGASQATLPL